MNNPTPSFPKSLSQVFPIPLQQFEAAVRAEQRVLGMLYTGSLGRGNADRFSDLDIELWVTADALVEADRTQLEILRYLGVVHFAYARGSGCTAFVGDDWQPVDLVFHSPAEVPSLSEYAHARIVKDTDQFLAHLLAGAKEETIDVSWEQARAMIEEAVDSQIYLSLHNARGATWSALGEVSYRATELYGVLAALRGSRSYGLRYVEHLLSPEEQALLAQTWPKEPSKQEVRRAAHALWEWTRYVWEEIERHLGRSLRIEVDEAALLAAVDRIYTR